jgi:ferredoxin
MSEYHVLDLFCGLGGFSQAFAESNRWGVTTVDIEERFDPDMVADVFDLRPSDFDTDFDVVLASPPCTTLSLAGNQTNHYVNGEPNTDLAKDHVALSHHTVGVIRGLCPNYWVLENPRGRMRRELGTPSATVTYCQYGFDWQKPTDLWGDHPPMSYHRCSPGSDCHLSAPSGFDGDGDTKTLSDASERAKVPYELSKSIRDACEQALDGDAVEQTDLEAF